MNMGCSNGGYHEFNLDWFLQKFKELMAEWNNTEREWEDLESYVKNYFNNLDISEEVKENFDKLVSSGDIYEMIGYNNFFAGKNLYFYGDSITRGILPDGSVTNNPYPKIIGNILKANVFNYAVAGATASNVEPTNNLLAQITQHPYDEADYIFVCFGTNDFSKSADLGCIDSEGYNTFYGSMIKCISDMQSNGKKVIILTPPGGKYIYNNYTQHNDKGILMYNYISACEKISDLLKTPCINLTKTFISYNNSQQFMQNSSSHYTEIGYQIIGEYIAKNLFQNNYFFGIGKGEYPLIISDQYDFPNNTYFANNQYCSGLRATVSGTVKLKRQIEMNRPAIYWINFFVNNLNTNEATIIITITNDSATDKISLLVPPGYSYQSVCYTPSMGGNTDVSFIGTNLQIFSFSMSFREPKSLEAVNRNVLRPSGTSLRHDVCFIEKNTIHFDVSFNWSSGDSLRFSPWNRSSGFFVFIMNTSSKDVIGGIIDETGNVESNFEDGQQYAICGVYDILM